MAVRAKKVLTPAGVKKNHADYDLGGFLFALRKAYGLSRSFVGDLVGRTPQSILTIESSGHFPRTDALLALARLYKVSPNLLFKKWLDSQKDNI